MLSTFYLQLGFTSAKIPNDCEARKSSDLSSC